MRDEALTQNPDERFKPPAPVFLGPVVPVWRAGQACDTRHGHIAATPGSQNNDPQDRGLDILDICKPQNRNTESHTG